jgi:glycosyltransferase involved in cell wall biosynthesis
MPAILFEPDGFRIDRERLMGRQSAGLGFLRAAVAAAGQRPLAGYTPSRQSAAVFAQTVREIDPAAQAQWLRPLDAAGLQALGHLYLPGPGLGDLARQRLRTGPAAWSLTGVTHTTASHPAMDAITDMVAAPVMPWDALICTSTAVLDTLRTVLAQQREYLGWRLGVPVAPPMPQLPVIPLGVHCDDFRIAPAQRAQARQALGIAPDDIVALFVGRLSFHAKAHPHAMYAALQRAARESGRRWVLLQCGWFANAPIEQAFRQGAAQACPDVRCLFTDGRDEAARRRSWAAGDVFLSLSDNVQETFGLTPVEAMAAGMPVVVTDWDGYRDTVRDGVDGFRIPTWLPPAGIGEDLAAAHEAGADSYDLYCGLTSHHASVDHNALAQRLVDLATQDGLLQRLGAAGQERARQHYDWAVVFRRYQELWRELDRVRTGAGATTAGVPRAAPGRMDPFRAFAGYPSHTLQADTRVLAQPGAAAASYEALASDPLFNYGARLMPTPQQVDLLLAALGRDAVSVGQLAQALGLTLPRTLRAVAVLAKMGLLRLAPPLQERQR